MARKYVGVFLCGWLAASLIAALPTVHDSGTSTAEWCYFAACVALVLLAVVSIAYDLGKPPPTTTTTHRKMGEWDA